MKVGVVGAGAMGTLFGTTLIKGGHDVTFLETWPALLNEISQNPFAHRITESGEEEIPVKVCNLSEVPDIGFDLLIIFVKSAGTRDAMNIIDERKLIHDDTIVLTCQGGFENPDIIASKMKNPGHLLPGCTTSFSKSAGKMRIINFGIRKTTVYPYDNSEPSSRVHEVIQKASDAGLMIEITKLAITDRWKMLLYYPTNIAVSAILRVPFGQCWSCPEGRILLTNLAKECAMVAKAEGIDDSLFNEDIAVHAVESLALDTPTHAGSMLTDVRLERVTEIDGTSGALLRAADKFGLDLPYTRSIWALLRTLEQSYAHIVK